MLDGQFPANELRDFMCPLIGHCQLQHMASDQASDFDQQQLHSYSPSVRRVGMGTDSTDLLLRVILTRPDADNKWLQGGSAGAVACSHVLEVRKLHRKLTRRVGEQYLMMYRRRTVSVDGGRLSCNLSQRACA